MARNDPQVNIRMPQALKEKLEAASAEMNRSLNGEIIDRLEASFETAQGVEISSKSLDKIVAGVVRPIEALIKEGK
ncbi:Arc family DNA-binding protein [Paraburkholderia tropica]|uniref:Arc family DNA-binding protein n=1 Tax=Paraburkholderia tropica TaxID=92647 RepID=UPI002AB6085D|nr:Arc family DNA-binding protein [Paraburkholderia tropica]